MLRKVMCIGLIVFAIQSQNVSAKGIFYQNENGVGFTKEEYEFLSKMFWDGCQDIMTLNDYDKFIESKIMDGEFESKELIIPVTRATSISDSNKSLKISKSCSTNCTISITASWKGNPTIHSYDVIGAYLSGTVLQGNPITTVSSGITSTTSNEIKRFSNGFGVSVKIPNYGNKLVINTVFNVSKGGTVYGSYQHAMKNISLSDSKNYTLSRNGFGGVFDFKGTAFNTYDRMSGVNISV